MIPFVEMFGAYVFVQLLLGVGEVCGSTRTTETFCCFLGAEQQTETRGPRSRYEAAQSDASRL
jgi:hypothetical protein